MKLYLIEDQLIRMDPLFNSAYRSFRFHTDTLIREHPENEDDEDQRRWYILREALSKKLGQNNDFVTIEFNFDGSLGRNSPPKLDIAVEGSMLKALHELLYLDSNCELLKIHFTATGKYYLGDMADTLTSAGGHSVDSDDDDDDEDDKWCPMTITATDFKLPKAASKSALHTVYQQKNVTLPSSENPPGDLWRKNNKGTWKLCVEVEVEKFVYHVDTVSHGSDINRMMLENRKFCDVTIVSGDGEEIPCHKLFLCINSPVFTSMLEGQRFKEGRENKICIEDMSNEGINALLKYLYCGDVRTALVNCHIALELYQAADKYDLKKLLNVMNLILTDKQVDWYDTEIALTLFQICEEKNVRLKEKCIEVLASKYDELEASQAFKEVFQTKTAREMILLSLKMYKEKGTEEREFS